jgi:hypothetical protein
MKSDSQNPRMPALRSGKLLTFGEYECAIADRVTLIGRALDDYLALSAECLARHGQVPGSDALRAVLDRQAS